MRPIIAAVAIIALIVVGVLFWHPWSRSSKHSAAVPGVSAPALKAAVQPQKTTPPLPSFELSGVHNGQGYEHPMIREFVHNPAIATGTKYAFTGDRSNKKEVRKWADITAACLAVDAGLVDRKTGKSLRVRKADTVVVDVQNDGNGHLVVAQYSRSELATQVAKQTQTSPPSNANPAQGVTSDGIALTAVMIYPTPPTPAQAHFVGHVVNGVDELPAPLIVYDWVHYPPNAA